MTENQGITTTIESQSAPITPGRINASQARSSPRRRRVVGRQRTRGGLRHGTVARVGPGSVTIAAQPA